MRKAIYSFMYSFTATLVLELETETPTRNLIHWKPVGGGGGNYPEAVLVLGLSSEIFIESVKVENKTSGAL